MKNIKFTVYNSIVTIPHKISEKQSNPKNVLNTSPKVGLRIGNFGHECPERP